jgi:hypothetical protein
MAVVGQLYFTAVNNTVIDSFKKDHISIELVINGLADHGANI